MVEKKGKSENNKPKTLSQQTKKEARNVNEQREKGWIHIIRVHDTIHSAESNIHSRSTPHKERMSGSLNIETTPSLVHRK